MREPRAAMKKNPREIFAGFCHPEGGWKLAGGANHRIPRPTGARPSGALEDVAFPPPHPGRILVVGGNRWLAPPANFRQPSGL